jgi:uncharacterized Ntn-hydrolase superfamily protein
VDEPKPLTAAGAEHVAGWSDIVDHTEAVLAIEAEAARRERERWTVERVTAAIHAGCEAEWQRRAAAGAMAITMHAADAHTETAARIVAAIRADLT